MEDSIPDEEEVIIILDDSVDLDKLDDTWLLLSDDTSESDDLNDSDLKPSLDEDTTDSETIDDEELIRELTNSDETPDDHELDDWDSSLDSALEDAIFSELSISDLEE